MNIVRKFRYYLKLFQELYFKTNISNENLLSLKNLIVWEEKTATLLITFSKNFLKLVKQVSEEFGNCQISEYFNKKKDLNLKYD